MIIKGWVRWLSRYHLLQNQRPHSSWKEQTPISCPLTFICSLWYLYADRHTHTDRQTLVYKRHNTYTHTHSFSPSLSVSLTHTSHWPPHPHTHTGDQYSLWFRNGFHLPMTYQTVSAIYEPLQAHSTKTIHYTSWRPQTGHLTHEILSRCLLSLFFKLRSRSNHIRLSW